MNFLQSTEWEEFQNSLGRTAYRIDNKLIIKLPLYAGLNYLYCPRPDFSSQKEIIIFLKESSKLAQKEKSVFLRLEPDFIENFNIENSMKIVNCKLKISKNIQPQDTIILDLHHTEETLLKNMHHKTRYNIRLAQKHNIKIKRASNPDDIEIFYNLAQKTSVRDNFSYHSKAYYKQMLKILGPKKMIELYISYTDDNIPTAGILILYFKDTAIYLHGASDHEYRNLMSPYLLQWEAIREAKKRGCKYYDFWGISPERQIPSSKKPASPSGVQVKNKSDLKIDNCKLEISNEHPWSGITRFKKGFANPPDGGAKIIHYPDCYDVVYNNFWYTLYKIAKKII